MRYVLVVLAAFGAILFFSAGYLVSSGTRPSERVDIKSANELPGNEQLEQRIEEQARRIQELEKQLEFARRDLADQRQIIREHALTDRSRSIDELLALFPAKFPRGDWRPAEATFEDCWFQSLDGLRLHGWYLKHDSPRAAILFAHGNAGNVTHRATIAGRLYRAMDASVLIFDYRGYGRSEGSPSIDGLVRDARAARDYLATREQIPASEIVLMGHSLGGAVVVQVAAEDGARGLVLESTFSTLREVADSHYPKLLVDLLVADRLDSRTAIAQYHGPLLISHGTADRTIPIALGRDLFDAANEPKTFIEIPGGDHNDLHGDDYYEQLHRLFAELPERK